VVDDALDVHGHSNSVAADDLEGEVHDAPVAVTEAQNVYWPQDGSTGCPRCSSSKFRGATFCLGCGRRLI
jgi:hypothetical protein